MLIEDIHETLNRANFLHAHAGWENANAGILLLRLWQRVKYVYTYSECLLCCAWYYCKLTTHQTGSAGDLSLAGCVLLFHLKCTITHTCSQTVTHTHAHTHTESCLIPKHAPTRSLIGVIGLSCLSDKLSYCCLLHEKKRCSLSPRTRHTLIPPRTLGDIYEVLNH